MGTLAAPGRLARLVRDARRALAMNQADFARLVGKTQPVVSRYEAGTVEPPGNVVMHCMHIMERHSGGIRRDAAGGAGAFDAVEDALAALQQAVRALYARPPD